MRCHGVFPNLPSPTYIFFVFDIFPVFHIFGVLVIFLIFSRYDNFFNYEFHISEIACNLQLIFDHHTNCGDKV